MRMGPGEYLPLLGVGLLAVTTLVAIGGAWAMGRVRGLQETARLRDAEADTHARIERMERHLETIAEEIERLGEVQRFALKVIGDKVVDAAEPVRLPHGRVITPH
jgi:hypothetical protein